VWLRIEEAERSDAHVSGPPVIRTMSPKASGAMSDADSLLWTIGRDPVLRMTVVAVALLDRAPRWKRLRVRVDDLTRMLPRLRSRAIPRAFGWWKPRWVEDGRFDLDLHLRRVRAAPPARLRTVLDMAQAMATTGFDPQLPLWEAVVVEELEDGKAAVVVKFHRALVDEVGAIAVLVHLLEGERHPLQQGREPARDMRLLANAPPSPSQPDSRTDEPDSRKDGARVAAGPTWRAGELFLKDRTSGASARLPGFCEAVIEAAARSAKYPSERVAGALAGAGSIAKLLAPARRPLSSLMSGRSIGRQFEVIDLPPGALLEAARAVGGARNDVFVAGIVMGLRRYHELHGTTVDRLRVLMPVKVRSERHPLARDHFVLTRFVLSAAGDAAACVREVHQIAGKYGRDPAPVLSDALATGLDLLPPQFATVVLGSMLKGDDFCVTNVPGPPSETYLAGARVEGLYAFAPPSGAAMNVSLLTPAGRETVGVSRDFVGVNIDSAAVPDGSKLVSCLEAGFEAVLCLTS
jgi:WS/DGAT/MGAT family acyltransferase